MGSLEHRLRRLEGEFPPLPEPIGPEDLPIEKWVDEEMEGYQWTGLYGIEEDEEQYERWCEWQIKRLVYRLRERMRESGLRLEEPLDPDTCEAIAWRVMDAFEPHARYWRERFDEAAPQREAKREMHKERLARKGG